MLSLLFALLAGVLTVAAPCTLPVLPLLLGAAIGHSDPLRPLLIALGFVVSFAAVVLVFSAVAQVFGLDQNTLRGIAIVLLLLFGVMLLWPKLFAWFGTRASAAVNAIAPQPANRRSGHLGSLLLGATLGLVWTPCAGPVLGSILAVIASSADFAWGGVLLTAYALGAALPMLAIGYGGQYATTQVRSIARYAPRLQQAFGVLVIGFAAAMYFQYDTLITLWLSDFYPNGQLGL